MLLLIPGPVTTRPEVRHAMAQDIAPWDFAFRAVYAGLRARVLEIAGGKPETHAVLGLQGCGHFGMEAAIRSLVAPTGKILVPVTGSYAERLIYLATEVGREAVPLVIDQNQPVSPAAVADALAADPAITHVGLIYSETSTGVVLDPVAIGKAVHAAGRRVILDAVSAFGALPLDVSAMPELDVAVFTSNKCLEGMPGLVFLVARIESVVAGKGYARSWSFDLSDIHANLLRDPGVFRFTPAVQVVAAFVTAVEIYDAEGGQPARLARYQANAEALYAGMQAIGLEPCLTRALQGPIVMNIHAPNDPAWSLQTFVDTLKQRGYLISNFYNTPTPSFRVGCIGAITPDNMRGFVTAVDATLTELNIRHRAPSRQAA